MREDTVNKKFITFVISLLIVVIGSLPSTGIFVNKDSEINTQFDLISRKRIILTSCTHWGGIETDGIAADDIEDWVKCVKYLNPDYLIHLGDITNSGKPEEFIQAYENFSGIINFTNVNKVWCTSGGAHDGLIGYKPIEEYFSSLPTIKFMIEKFKSTKIGEKIYVYINHLTQFLRERFKLGFYKILNQTSQWYTLKIGNNVFIIVGYFNEPWTWASGEYGGFGEANILNMNKVNWLNKTLAKWNGTGNNIFICHHFPLYHTNIYTHLWPGMNQPRFVYESKMIMDIISNYTDVVAWFSGHVHVDSNATFSNNENVSKGTAVSGASRPDLPDHIHFISCGNIWKEHGVDNIMKNSFANFRYFDLIDGKDYIDFMAWDSTNNKTATMTVNNTEIEVEKYRVNLPYAISNISDPLIYEQAWDVYDYCELRYKWYKDSEGLRRDHNGWIESRWDFWDEKDFSNALLSVDTSNSDALNHKIYYSVDGMQTWNKQWYTPNNLTSMPSGRWIKVITYMKTHDEIFIRDMSFEFL